MESIQLVISIISLLAGGFVLILSVFILIKFRNIVYLSYILLYSGLFLYTAYLTFQNLLPIFAFRFPTEFLVFTDTVGSASKAFLIFCLPFLFHYLYEVPNRRLRNSVWGTVSLAVILCIIIQLFHPIVIQGCAVDYILEMAALLSVYIYLVVLFFKYRKKMRNTEIRSLHRVYIVLLSLYMISSLLQFVLFAGQLIPEYFLKDNLLVPLLFIAWNVFFLKFILAFLQVKPIAVPGVDIGAFDIMNRSDITPREKEIIHELLTGSTVSAIATKLFISGHTAKTHVKNIYQKLEVKNRVELMNLITAQQESYSQKNRPQTPPSPLF